MNNSEASSSDSKGKEPVQEEPVKEVPLTLQMLANACNIIDAASKRGAFKAEELEVVGKTYNELKMYIYSKQK